MADHPTNPEEQQPADTLSEGSNAAASADDKTVPLSELVKQRQRAAEAERKWAEAQAQLEKVSQATKSDRQPPKPTESNPFEDRLKRMERQESLRTLMAEHGLDAKQANAVHAILEEMPSLNETEARQVAALRDPDAFAEGASAAGYDPAVHGSSRPRPGSMPTAQSDNSDYDARLEHAKKLLVSGNKKAHQRFVNNMVGRIAARQVGRPGHESIPLPRKT